RVSDLYFISRGTDGIPSYTRLVRRLSRSHAHARGHDAPRFCGERRSCDRDFDRRAQRLSLTQRTTTATDAVVALLRARVGDARGAQRLRDPGRSARGRGRLVRAAHACALRDRLRAPLWFGPRT